MRAILAEVRHLLDYGFLEIELLGQTVNHWREPGGEADFADLLDAVARMPGLERLRFVTSYPRDFTPRMVEQIGLHENICPYLHLPVQSGSNRVLKRMGRGYEVEPYYQLVSDLRAARPDLALSTDLIVGFPGETDEDFEATLRLIEEIRYASIYAFKYSPRPGTAAPRLGEGVAREIADERLQRILSTQEVIQKQLNEELVGTRHDVLVTGYGKEPGHLQGRTPCHRIVHFPYATRSRLPDLGTLTPIEVETALPHSLLGRSLATPSRELLPIAVA